jgi:putative hemolysin
MLENKVSGAKRIANLIEKPERLLSTILLGNNFVNVAAASLATILATSIWGEEIGVIVATVTLTIVLLIFAETTPKTIATRHPEKLSQIYYRPIEFFSWLFTPFVTILSWIAGGFARLFGGAPLHSSLVGEDEIRTLITVGHKEGTFEEKEAEMLHNVFEFGDRPVSDILVPRPDVIAIEKGTNLKEFLALYTHSPVSRFPVFEENMDNVIGVISVKDVLMTIARNNIDTKTSIDDMIRPIYFTPESKRIGELFTEMRENNYRMAVVVDEYGGTAGIVSLSRLMEEIVGPVGDELAEAEKEYESINEYTFQVDGGMRVDEANAELIIDLPESEEYETLAGFVMHLLGYIPHQGQQVRYKNLKLVITKKRGHKIEEILLTKEKRAKAEN